MVCQNCCEIVEKTYIFRMNVEKNQSKECCNPEIECNVENDPTTAPHKSVSDLYKEYPGIIIPEQVTQFDIAPVISLDESEVTDWFRNGIKRADGNRPGFSVIIKRVPKIDNFYKVIQYNPNVSVDNAPYNTSDTCIGAVPNNTSHEVNVASQNPRNIPRATLQPKRNRHTNDLEIIPSKKKRIYLNKKVISAPKKINVHQMLPTVTNQQKLFVSSMGLSSTAGNPHIDCVRNVTASRSPILQREIQAQSNAQGVSSESKTTEIPIWTVDMLAEACRTIDDLKETGKVMSLLGRGNSDIHRANNAAPVSQELRSGDPQPALQVALQPTGNRVVPCAAPTEESLAAGVSPLSDNLQCAATPTNTSAYQNGIKRAFGSRAVATTAVDRTLAFPAVRVKQTSVAQSATNLNISGKNHQLSSRQDLQNKNSLTITRPSKKAQGVAGQTSSNPAQSITLESLLKSQPVIRYKVPSIPATSRGVRFAIGAGPTNQRGSRGVPVSIAGGNFYNVARTIPGPQFVAGLNGASSGVEKRSATSAPVSSRMFNSQYTTVAAPVYKPPQNTSAFQTTSTNLFNPTHIPNGSAYDTAMNQIVPEEGNLPQEKYYLPIMDDEFIETSFLQEPITEILGEFPTMSACSIRTPQSLFKDGNCASGANADRLLSPRASPTTYEQALQSYSKAGVDPTPIEGSSQKKQRYIRIKNISDLK